MTCAELEILLCGYVDGTLRGAEKTALESHLAECSACAELAKDVAGVTAFIDTVATAEPPAELLTRILHVIPNGRQKTERPSWWRKLFGGWVNTVLSPRYAMGMAMTVLSFSMIAKRVSGQRRERFIARNTCRPLPRRALRIPRRIQRPAPLRHRWLTPALHPGSLSCSVLFQAWAPSITASTSRA